MITAVDQREATAYHEAGHGVLDVVTRQRVRYITLRPRGGALGHVMPARLPRWGTWLDQAAALFAGIIAEDLHHWSEPNSRWWDCGHEELRRSLVQDCGRSDMLMARDVLRFAWECQWTDQECPLTPAVDPAWLIRDMAEMAWRHAVVTVITHAEAVAELASLLYESSRAVTWKQAQVVVAAADKLSAAEVDEVLGEMDLLRPWFLEHSRLNWEPKGATRPVITSAAARGDDHA